MKFESLKGNLRPFDAMPYFVRLTTFTSEGAKELKTFSNGRKQFLRSAKKLKIKVVGEYVLTGR